MKFACHCGLRCTVELWPFTCVCGRVYRDADSEPLQQEPAVDTPADGPGTELKAMLAEIGANAAGCGGCESLAADMNRWGLEGCRRHRQAIIAHLQRKAAKLGLLELAKVSVSLPGSSWAGAISILDPWGSLVDEAIRRADEKAGKSAPPSCLPQ